MLMRPPPKRVAHIQEKLRVHSSTPPRRQGTAFQGSRFPPVWVAMDIPYPEYLRRVVSAVKADPAEFEIEETEDEESQQVLQGLFTSLARRRLIPLINNHLTTKEKINHVYPETIV